MFLLGVASHRIIYPPSAAGSAFSCPGLAEISKALRKAFALCSKPKRAEFCLFPSRLKPEVVSVVDAPKRDQAQYPSSSLGLLRHAHAIRSYGSTIRCFIRLQS